MLLTDLPEFLLRQIFSYLSYDEIARNRIVCRQFNEVGWYLLNNGFHAAEKYQSSLLKAVKLQLPRRESERKKHPLSKIWDTLMNIDTRLSLLSMAFSRFIDTKLCCFIPGKVIDELFRVMRYLDNTFNLHKDYQISQRIRDVPSMAIIPSSLEILKELRDVSTMAIEYFDDNIAPDLRRKEMIALSAQRAVPVFGKLFNNVYNDLASKSSSDANNCDFRLKPSSSVMQRQSIDKIVEECCRRCNKDSSYTKIKKKKDSLEEKRFLKLVRFVRKQNRIIKDLTETVKLQSVRLSNNEAIINDLKKQQDEWKHNCSNFSQLMTVSTEGDSLNISSPSASKQKLADEEVDESARKKRKITNEIDICIRTHNLKHSLKSHQ